MRSGDVARHRVELPTVIFERRKPLADLTVRMRLPTVTQFREMAELGVLMWGRGIRCGDSQASRGRIAPVIPAVEAPPECEQAVRGYVERAASGPGQAQTVGSVVIYPRIKMVMLYRCLPDTFDPRGSKGR